MPFVFSSYLQTDEGGAGGCLIDVVVPLLLSLQDRMLGIYSDDDHRHHHEAAGARGHSAEEEKAEQACAAPASPSVTSTASSASPLLQAAGGRVTKEGRRTRCCQQQKRDEATVECQRSRDDLDDFDELLESYSEHPSAVEDLRNEVLTLPANCPDCNAPASANMKVTSKSFGYSIRDLSYSNLTKPVFQ